MSFFGNKGHLSMVKHVNILRLHSSSWKCSKSETANASTFYTVPYSLETNKIAKMVQVGAAINDGTSSSFSMNQKYQCHGTWCIKNKNTNYYCHNNCSQLKREALHLTKMFFVQITPTRDLRKRSQFKKKFCLRTSRKVQMLPQWQQFVKI